MKASCYLIVAKSHSGGAIVKRTTKKRPSLAYNEAVIRLMLELPDDLFEAPVFTVPVEKRNVQVAIEVDEV